MTHFHSIPETEDALVVLTNSQRSWPFMRELLRVWSGLDVEAPGMHGIACGERRLKTLTALSVVLVIAAIVCMDVFGKPTRLAGIRAAVQIGVGSVLILLVGVFPKGAPCRIHHNPIWARRLHIDRIS